MAGGTPPAALSQAFRALKEVKGAGNILILTDLTRGDWEGLDLSKTERVPAETGITFPPNRRPQAGPEPTIKEVSLTEGDAVAGASSRLEATLANYSDSPVSSTVSLFLSGVKRDQKNLELKAGEEERISFDAFFEKSGWVDGELRLEGISCPSTTPFISG